MCVQYGQVKNYRCRTNLGNTSSINAHRSLLLTAAAAQGNTTYALATQQYELCASSMGRGDCARRARKVHPTAAQSLPPPSLPLLLIVRVSTRRNIDFTMKFATADDYDGVKKEKKMPRTAAPVVVAVVPCVSSGKRGPHICGTRCIRVAIWTPARRRIPKRDRSETIERDLNYVRVFGYGRANTRTRYIDNVHTEYVCVFASYYYYCYYYIIVVVVVVFL